MRTNSSPWSNHSYIGMILGWKVIRFKRAISTLTHWSLPFGSLCSFHFGIWISILSTFRKYPLFGSVHFSKISTFQKYPLFKNVHFSKMSTFQKCPLLENVHLLGFCGKNFGTYFFLFDNFYGDWFFIGSFYSGKDLSKSATSNKFFFLIKTKVWSIFICVRERAPVNFFQILKNVVKTRSVLFWVGTVLGWNSFGIVQFWIGTVLGLDSFRVGHFWVELPWGGPVFRMGQDSFGVGQSWDGTVLSKFNLPWQ